MPFMRDANGKMVWRDSEYLAAVMNEFYESEPRMSALDAPVETIELLPHYEVRVWELAKTMGVKSKTVLRGLRAMGRTVRSASSKVEIEEIERDALEAYIMDRAF